MNSFVNLMASDRWSEADIVRRTEAMVASEYPRDEREILGRLVDGLALGQYVPTAEEFLRIQGLKEAVLAARIAGDAARADMDLLGAALDVESAQAELASLPEVIEGEDDEHADRRGDLETLILSADADVLQLVMERAEANAQPELEEPDQEPEEE